MKFYQLDGSIMHTTLHWPAKRNGFYSPHRKKWATRAIIIIKCRLSLIQLLFLVSKLLLTASLSIATNTIGLVAVVTRGSLVRLYYHYRWWPCLKAAGASFMPPERIAMEKKAVFVWFSSSSFATQICFCSKMKRSNIIVYFVCGKKSLTSLPVVT